MDLVARRVSARRRQRSSDGVELLFSVDSGNGCQTSSRPDFMAYWIVHDMCMSIGER